MNLNNQKPIAAKGNFLKYLRLQNLGNTLTTTKPARPERAPRGHACQWSVVSQLKKVECLHSQDFGLYDIVAKKENELKKRDKLNETEKDTVTLNMEE